MDTAAEIKKALMSVLGVTPNLPLTATVVSIQGNTCTIKILGELVLSDVRLTATVTDSNGLLIQPKVGSEVLVISQTGTLSSLVVLKVNEVDLVYYKSEDFEVRIDAFTKKVTVKNAQVNLAALMNTLIETISAAVITTPNGPGSIDPSTVTALNNIKTQFNLILNAS